jgi:TonB family protein
MTQRRKRNSSKVNLTISFIFHALVILVVAYFAAREGILGKKLKEITVTMAPKEKKPEPPKPKPPEPKVEPPKPAEPPKVATAAPPPPALRVEPPSAPPVVEAPPPAAPAAVSLPAFEFNDGARDVQTVSDPNTLYKGLVEHALRSHWNRPEDIADDTFVAEIQLTIDAEGNVTGSRWLKGSGNPRWDGSVKAAVAATKVITRPPPKGFPPAFVARFDVESTRTEDLAQASGGR